MKKLIIAVLAFLPVFAFATDTVLTSETKVRVDKAQIDVSDKASLQSGAKLFMNYCAGCHSTQYQRYNRVAADLGIPEDVMQANLNFTGVAVGDLMTNAIPEKDAANWFGAPPPDLTLVARVRGTNWLYTYLRTFYIDEERPFGVNNLIFPSVGMPHVLEPLQGRHTAQVTKFTKSEDADQWTNEDGTISWSNKQLNNAIKDSAVVYKQTTQNADTQVKTKHVTLTNLSSDGKGELSGEEYDQAALDLVNFLAYSADPVKLERHRIGYWVLGFLVIFFIFGYLLKKEYWRDVH